MLYTHMSRFVRVTRTDVQALRMYVSSHISQLDRLLKHFSLDAWNPCMVVDTPCFERLLRGDAAERYMYFMEASDLVSAKPSSTML
jgi:hypothetical protein